MGIHIVVDGYNLMYVKNHYSSAHNIEGASMRETLISELQNYARLKKHKLTVVFDGWKNGYQQEYLEKRKNIRVIFSRIGERADDYIYRLVQKERKKTVVVTSDNELRKRVESADGTVIKSHDFISCINRSQSDKIEKDEEEKEPVLHTRKKGPSKKLSKRKRLRMARLKQL